MSRRALRDRERAQSQAAGVPDMTPPGSFATMSSSSTVPSPQPASQYQTGPAASYRVRDYSPDARGNQFSTVGRAPTSGIEPVRPVESFRPAASGVPSAAAPVVERTLTRRELRELREASERVVHPGSQGAEFAQPARPPELIEPVEPRSQRAAPQQYSAPQQYPLPQSMFGTAAPDWNLRQPEPAPNVAMVSPEAYARPAPEFELPSGYAAPFGQPAPPSTTAAVPPPPPTSVAGRPAYDGGFSRPAGHWSRQADLDARTQLDDVLPSRDLSQSAAITTSALVLPAMPTNPIGALSSTGEILVTGSIDLPRMLGATGVHPARFDHAEFDSLLEAGDREDSHPSSAPVRAIRAVSTHTSTQGMIAAKRPRSKVPIYLLASVATVMGVGVVVLFVGGMLLDLF